MARPTGVTVLAILHYLSAVLLVLGGIGLIFGMSAVGAMIANANGGDNRAGVIGFMAGFGIVMGIFLFLGAAITGILGWGLWKLKNWARIVVMIFAVLGAAAQLFPMLISLIKFNPLGIVVAMFWMGIDLLIAWYLFQPHVKQAFSAAPSAMAAGA
jgi:hypothetical protein